MSLESTIALQGVLIGVLLALVGYLWSKQPRGASPAPKEPRVALEASVPRCTVARRARDSPQVRNNAGGKRVWPSETGSLRLRAREYFHVFLNEEKFPQCRALAEEFLEPHMADARVYMQADDPSAPVPELCTFFKYDRGTFLHRVGFLYERMMTVAFKDWQAAGCPPKWYSTSRSMFSAYLLNEAPFHLTDGAWLRSIAPVGVIDEHSAALIAVWIDEIGNGTVHMNHCNVYDAVLRSAGFFLPPVDSELFMNQEDILDEAFVNPTVALAFSLFPKRYLPEILGETLFLELSSSPLHAPLGAELKRFHLSPTFSKLHVAIDNPSSGHARMAADAIMHYLDGVASRLGEDAVQEHWKRIWTGYVTFAISGGVSSQLQEHVRVQDAPEMSERDFYRSEMVRILHEKAVHARHAHGKAKFKGRLLNDWFSDDNLEQFLTLLGDSKALVKRGDPQASRLLSSVCSFTGPMFRVFTTAELQVIHKWIETLADENEEEEEEEEHVPDPNATDILGEVPVSCHF